MKSHLITGDEVEIVLDYDELVIFVQDNKLEKFVQDVLSLKYTGQELDHLTRLVVPKVMKEIAFYMSVALAIRYGKVPINIKVPHTKPVSLDSYEEVF